MSYPTGTAAHAIEIAKAEIAELAYQAELDQEKKAEEEAAKAAVAAKKAEILAKLGLDEEEVAAFLA